MLKDNEELTEYETAMVMMERAIEKDNARDRLLSEQNKVFSESVLKRIQEVTNTSLEPISSTVEVIESWAEEIAIMNELSSDEVNDLIARYDENRERELPTRTVSKDVFLDWYFSELDMSSMNYILEQYVEDLRKTDFDLTAQTLFDRTPLIPASICSDYVERFDEGKEFEPNKKVWLTDD